MASLAEGGCLLVLVSMDDLAPGSASDFLLNMGFLLIAFPNLSSRSPHSVEGMTLLTTLGSTARLAEDGCLLALESADEIRLS